MTYWKLVATVLLGSLAVFGVLLMLLGVTDDDDVGPKMFLGGWALFVLTLAGALDLAGV